MEQKISFQDSEHLAGLHNTFQEGCYECYREARLIKARKVVNIPRIEMPPKDWVKNLMNKIIWGDNRHFYE